VTYDEAIPALVYGISPFWSDWLPTYSDLIVSITAKVITINVTITMAAVIPFTSQIRLAGLYQ
jgi:hypothetical protein